MISALQKKDEGTLQLTVSIPSDDIAKTREAVVDELVKHADLPGFRKGKAPKKIVEEKLSPETIREEILKKLLPKYYVQAVEEHTLKPIVSPRIHVQQVEEGKDWQFTATTCEMPEIKLGNYKDKIKSLTAKSKIVVPGKKEAEAPKFDEIVQAILESASVSIPSILIEQEVERSLAHLLDDVKRLGLTLDQYLASTGRKPEDLRSEYEQKARNDISFEFIIGKIAEEEKITVEPKEVEDAIAKAKDPKERENLEKNRYLLASIIRQQKTLDFLKNL